MKGLVAEAAVGSEECRRQYTTALIPRSPGHPSGADFYGISSWQNWQTESWKQISPVEVTNETSTENRRTYILRLCSACGQNNTIAKEAWATKLSELWDPMTFIDKNDITGRPVQFH